MAKRKSSPQATNLVWRISEAAPLGELVDLDTLAIPTIPLSKNQPEVSSGGWVMSSFDLLHGTDISEDEDTVPGDLFDELFPGSPKNSPKTSE